MEVREGGSLSTQTADWRNSRHFSPPFGAHS